MTLRGGVAGAVDRLDQPVVVDALADQRLVEGAELLDAELDIVRAAQARAILVVEAPPDAGIDADMQLVDQPPEIVGHAMQQHAVGVDHDGVGDADASAFAQEGEQLGVQQRLATDDPELAGVEHLGQRFEVAGEIREVGKLLRQQRRGMRTGMAADVAMLRQAVFDAEPRQFVGRCAGHAGPRIVLMFD